MIKFSNESQPFICQSGFQTGLIVSASAEHASRSRVDPLPMTTHRFSFGEFEMAFHIMDKKDDGMIKPLISLERSCVVGC